MADTIDEITAGMVDAGDNLYLDSNGNWMTTTAEGDAVDNQWVWTDQGLIPMGSVKSSAVNDPFLTISEEYRGGAPIEAATWQEAVSKSLEGFMRSNYGIDPIFNWEQGKSGLGEGQFKLGTLQELANAGDIPGQFFNTGGEFVINVHPEFGPIGEPIRVHRKPGKLGQDPSQLEVGAVTDINGNVIYGDSEYVTAGKFDPLLPFNPDDKFLGFEDIPFETLEKLVGGNLPGQLLNPHTGQLMTLEEARNSSAADFNDYLFKLNMEQYAPPPEVVKASSEAVLNKFFDLPQYELAFGQDARQLDPQDRFKADPGYQFAVDEGMRQINRGSAAKGLLESGATQRDLLRYGQGMADQNYQRWMGQQMGLYGNWQDQLRGIAGQGAQLSGQAGQQTLGTGAALGGLNTQLGNNLASLYGNQGVLGANAFLNTGAAQASQVMNSAALSAQIQQANTAAHNQKMGAIGNAFASMGGAMGGGGGGF